MLRVALALFAACAAAMSRAQTPEVHLQPRILLLGDSLTAGFHRGGHTFHPYASKLLELSGCRNNFAGLSGWTTQQLLAYVNPDAEATTDGTGRTWQPLHKAFAAAKLEGAPFTHAVLLAGTNDLGHLGRRGEDVTKDTVVRNLFDILWMLKTAGVNKTFLCTVPETAWEEAAPWGRVAREEINSQILYRASISDGFTVSVDVAKLLPRSGVDAEAVKRRWDDGLHFTPDGYDELGAAVAAALKGAGVACDATHKAGHATSTSLEVRSAGAARHAARHHHGHVGWTGAVAE